MAISSLPCPGGSALTGDVEHQVKGSPYCPFSSSRGYCRQNSNFRRKGLPRLASVAASGQDVVYHCFLANHHYL